MLVLILVKLTTEIEAVKMLSYDPCRLCENKTGAKCWIERDIKGDVKTILDINLTEIEGVFGNQSTS